MNNELIKKLSQDKTAVMKMDSVSAYTLKWLLFSLCFFLPCLFFLPWRPDISVMMGVSGFVIESLIWLVLSLFSAYAFYESLYPETDSKKYLLGIGGLFLIAVLLSQVIPNETGNLSHEMNFYQGRCGIIISLFSLVQCPLLFAWARKGAPTSPGVSGIFAAVSTAALGVLLMQVVCGHANRIHLILWHFMPLVLLCSLSFYVSKKVLRW